MSNDDEENRREIKRQVREQDLTHLSNEDWDTLYGRKHGWVLLIAVGLCLVFWALVLLALARWL